MAVKASGVISLLRVDDGDSSYVWVKYADNKLGVGISDIPDGKMYFGIAYNKTTSSESNNPADYTWSAMYDLDALEEKADKTQVIQLSNQWTQTTDLANSHTGLIANLGTDINLRVKKNELLSQINVQADNVLIQTGKLYLDVGSVTMTTAFVTDLNVKTLSAVYADIPTIRNKVLITDAVTTNMIKADAGLFDKVFINDAVVQKLTAKASFINSVKAIDITADRVTGGTFNAALMNVVGMNASSIVTGTLNGISITSPFNYIYSGTTRNVGITTIAQGDITMVGSFNNSYGSTYLKLNADGLYGDNLTSSGAVRSLFKLNGDGITVVKGSETAYYRQDGVYFESGGNASIKYWAPNARIEIGSYNGVGLGVNSSGQFWNRLTVGGGQDGLDPFVDIWVDLTLRQHMNVQGNNISNIGSINGITNIFFKDTTGRIVKAGDGSIDFLSPIEISLGWTDGTNTSSTVDITRNRMTVNKEVQFNAQALFGMQNIRNAESILFNQTSNRLFQSSNGQLHLLSPNMLNLGWTDGTSVFSTLTVTKNQITAFKNLNMNGNNIVGQSDRRLKTNIVSAIEDSLGAISRWDFVDYEWKDSSKPKGIKFGLIAQDTPELSLYDAERDIYNINSSKQTMMNSHAIQQINQKVVSIDSLITATNSIANNAMHKALQVDNEVQQMKNKISELDEKIKLLESVE